MTEYKIVGDVADTTQAQAVGTALMELVEPAAIAWSRFEQPGGWRVEAYYLEQPAADAIEAAVQAIFALPDLRLHAEAVPDENWVTVSQAALPPVHAGRFTIHGSHDRHKIARGPFTIEIDAGEAFGTAHHATTWGCLLAIDRLTRRPCRLSRVLDLGCGTGVLAIAAARMLPAARVDASDIDPEAVRVARDNVARNEVPRIHVTVADGLGRPGKPYDLLIANILAGPLIDLAPRMRPAVRAGGCLVLSGILNEQAAQVRAAYHAQGFVLQRKDRIAGWTTLTLRKHH